MHAYNYYRSNMYIMSSDLTSVVHTRDTKYFYKQIIQSA